jgi:hypothetical protein
MPTPQVLKQTCTFVSRQLLTSLRFEFLLTFQVARKSDFGLLRILRELAVFSLTLQPRGHLLHQAIVLSDRSIEARGELL